MAKNPLAVLWDAANGAFAKYIVDGSDSLLGVAGKLRSVAGTFINPATEDTLALIKTTDGIKKIVDALPSGTNEVGKVAQGTKAAAAAAWPIYAVDSSGNIVGVVLDGAVYRWRTESKVVRASDGAQINPATEETLALIKDTNGIKKIVDALPIGDNRIGRVKITDDTNVAGVDATNHQYVSGKAAVGAAPSANPVYIGGIDSFGYKRGLRTDSDGRIQTVAATVPGLSATMINLTYNATDAAIASGSFKRVLTYTIPLGYSAYLIRFTTFQGEAAYSRLVIEKEMAYISFLTNAYTAGSSYTYPQFASAVEAEVTTEISSAANVTVTVTYTNQSGTGSRTGTITVAKSSLVGTRFPLVMQSGDIGVQSIQNLSASPSGNAGVIKVLGFIQLAWHNDLSITQGVYTDYAPSAISFPTGTVLGIEYRGGTAAKERILGALVQLVQ